MLAATSVSWPRSDMGHMRRLQGRLAETAAIYAETLPVWQELGQRAAAAYELECLAFIATASGPAQSQCAAQLFGVAEVLRQQIGSPLTIIERREYDQALAQLRAQTEPIILASAWAKG